ncbi:MAG: 16S rRNA (guanine(966)-N(2))-methyltransferase RsmD [Bacteroidetes Order II. Incertae sedis bacterium]|jgi:16S rRNA (guanine966-N2)-methyltransferase|nr:16S rRNA (guanine(966)-N(2))-methyltransferase RsmD [Bacteroidetes Order II. bacterium]MDG1753395.1 16S rRNA (guanine(966)-N(2))-methyltransferase RsmD [Rhodothermales bacterium]HAY37716.1 16S rRNA (guanine(966)-N(2))-methyltransferase RsmD [Bacteroidota bacterium]MBT4603740.1 16S rRNA (guanine(966)-N(2))-methyltransferase RsmD [Bacteroidetes Order II. bacterium]MBT5250666.1 16S rRNA (guanine(966)-N(2))-methyltransferase RsmD [Bacteroidetes Order II. bacterium]
MRIISGRFKRRVLKSPSGDQTRPTTDRAREAIFNLIVSRLDLHDASVLDLFAGTGALGLEAMSRGAGSLDCVEVSGQVLKVARDNMMSLDAQMRCRFIRSDVHSWLKTAKGRYRLILADPPYALEEIEELPSRVIPLLAEDGLLVLEHDRKIRFESHPFRIETRKYGKSAVSIFSSVQHTPSDHGT